METLLILGLFAVALVVALKVFARKASTGKKDEKLDYSSHHASDRQKADQKKDKACADAGLTIIRWKQIPDRNEIRKALGLS